LDDTVGGRVIMTLLLCDTAVTSQSYVGLCFVHIVY